MDSGVNKPRVALQLYHKLAIFFIYRTLTKIVSKSNVCYDKYMKMYAEHSVKYLVWNKCLEACYYYYSIVQVF